MTADVKRKIEHQRSINQEFEKEQLESRLDVTRLGREDAGAGGGGRDIWGQAGAHQRGLCQEHRCLWVRRKRRKHRWRWNKLNVITAKQKLVSLKNLFLDCQSWPLKWSLMNTHHGDFLCSKSIQNQWEQSSDFLLMRWVVIVIFMRGHMVDKLSLLYPRHESWDQTPEHFRHQR